MIFLHPTRNIDRKNIISSGTLFPNLGLRPIQTPVGFLLLFEYLAVPRYLVMFTRSTNSGDNTWRAPGSGADVNTQAPSYLTPGSGKGFEAGRGRSLRPAGQLAAPGSAIQAPGSPSRKYSRTDMVDVLQDLTGTVRSPLTHRSHSLCRKQYLLCLNERMLMNQCF